mgnify:CR=1 FL=1|jgi:hypothetical protein
MLLAVLFKLDQTTLQPVSAHFSVFLRISSVEVARTVAGKFKSAGVYISFNSLVVTARDHAHSIDDIIMQGHWFYWVDVCV